MPESLYNAINGQEARDTINRNINQFVNTRLGLKRGNTFHGFQVYLYLKVRAIPADVPTPEGEYEFTFLSNSLNDITLAELKSQFTKYMSDHTALVQIRDEINAHLARHFPEIGVYEETISDNNTPDELRVKNQLPLHVLELDRNTNRTAEIEKNIQELNKKDAKNYTPVDLTGAKLI
jgi:hypothetical protein